MLLISHRREWVAALQPCASVDLRRASADDVDDVVASVPAAAAATPIDCGRRTCARAGDYILISAPLIIVTFIASGGAIAMLFGDALSRTSVLPSLLAVLDEEAKVRTGVGSAYLWFFSLTFFCVCFFFL